MLALLHTSPVHVPVFDALRDAHHPALVLRHTVDAALLEHARAEGPEAVGGAVGAAVLAAVGDGARAVLCTCSTLGAVAERVAAGVPVLRVDRPMAAAAAAMGRRIVVVAAVASTVEPTVELLREEAGRRSPRIGTLLVDGAWALFEAGDRDGYLDAVAAAVDGVRDADAIVLAQASMADATARTRTAVPVLSSPRPGLAAAAAAAAAPERHPGRHTGE
ncbi:aspartate/glutamate racemase family protein [Streptomyces sp. NPDC013953]|uniref:aspartate/glutamate racemase family protein n=1 Tax=Streptomyces sp. NPDC013953 TaxID=3364868 RepID=UPI0036F9CCD2